MDQYVDDLKKNENYFVLFNEKNFNNYILTDVLTFDFKEFIMIMHFFSDFYDFDIYSEMKDNEYMIMLRNSISRVIGYEFCGFYPKANCKYTNTEIKIERENQCKDLIDKIKEMQRNRFAPSKNNKRILCFHNGDGEFKDGIPLNPIIFDYNDFLFLQNFCLNFFNFDFDLFFHGKFNYCYHILDQNMQSFFQRRVLSSNIENTIVYSDEKYVKRSIVEKEELIKKMKSIKV